MTNHLRNGREAALRTISARFSLDFKLDIMDWKSNRDLRPAAAECFVELDVSDGTVGADGEEAFLKT